jgi:hypothetical protein
MATRRLAVEDPSRIAMDRWLMRNLQTQGYCLSDAEARGLRVGLRFSTGLCLPFVATGIAVKSVALLGAAVAIGTLAGFTARHPFDHLWNGVVRHAFGAAPVPPNPARRRDAFKIATAMLVVLVVLVAVGWYTAALIFGGSLLLACLSVTALNLCFPSEALALIDRLRGRTVTT